MGWTVFLNSAGIRASHFENYESAIKHFNNTTPIRGRTPELRPLGGNRKFTHCTILHDPLTDGVSANLYGTPCVTIYPDNTLRIAIGGWASFSTINFINAVLPSRFGGVYLSKGRVVYIDKQGGNYIVPTKGILLRINQGGKTGAEVIPDEINPPPTQYEYIADRKVMNRIRKQIQPFLDAVRVMSSMSTEYTIQEIAEYFPEAISLYADKVNEHNRKMKLQKEGDKSVQGYYGYFNEGATMRESVSRLVSANLLYTLQNLNYISDGKAQLTRFLGMIETMITTSREPDNPDTKARNAESIRKLMIQVATNDFTYGKVLDSAAKVNINTAFGEVAVPNLTWYTSASCVENYLISVIKYVYADIVFKKVEVPQGVLPSTTNQKYVDANKHLVEQGDIVTLRHFVQ